MAVSQHNTLQAKKEMLPTLGFPNAALAKKVRRKYPQFSNTFEKWEAEVLSSSSIDGEDVLKRCSSPNGSTSSLVGALVVLGEGVQSGVTDFRPLRIVANALAKEVASRCCDGANTNIIAGKICFHSECPFTIVELLQQSPSSSSSVNATRRDDTEDSDAAVVDISNVSECYAMLNAAGGRPSHPNAPPMPQPTASESHDAAKQFEWVAAVRKRNSAAGDEAKKEQQSVVHVGSDFYTVRLMLAANGDGALSSSLPSAFPSAKVMPLGELAKLIANCDGVPVVPTTSQDGLGPVDSVAPLQSAAPYAQLVPIPIAEIPGLFAVPNFISEDEERLILEELAAYEQCSSGASADGATADADAPASSAAANGSAQTTTPWEQLARRDVLHFSRRFFYDTMKVGAVGEQVSGPNPSFYERLVDRLCTGVAAPLFPYSPSPNTTVVVEGGSSSAGAVKRPRDEEGGVGSSPPAAVARAPWPVPLDHRCDQLTVNRYRYDAKKKLSSGIAQHVDVHSFFGDIVFSVSLKSHTLLEYERPLLGNREVITKRVPIYAPPRSLLIMTAESRFLWTHAIQHKYADVVDERSPALVRGDRVSLTLRKARDDPQTEHNLSNCPYPFMCDSKV